MLKKDGPITRFFANSKIFVGTYLGVMAIDMILCVTLISIGFQKEANLDEEVGNFEDGYIGMLKILKKTEVNLIKISIG